MLFSISNRGAAEWQIAVARMLALSELYADQSFSFHNQKTNDHFAESHFAEKLFGKVTRCLPKIGFGEMVFGKKTCFARNLDKIGGHTKRFYKTCVGCVGF